MKTQVFKNKIKKLASRNDNEWRRFWKTEDGDWCYIFEDQIRWEIKKLKRICTGEECSRKNINISLTVTSNYFKSKKKNDT